jgi:hypothetical protein
MITCAKSSACRAAARSLRSPANQRFSRERIGDQSSFFAPPRIVGAAAFSTAVILPRVSFADRRPTETVRIIVPAAAGGTTDVMGRLLAAHLQTA